MAHRDIELQDFFDPPQYSRFLSGSFSNRQGYLLYSYAWLPIDSEPTASVFIVHGFGEHAGRYRWLANALTARGYAVFSYDLQGHGRSTGERGCVRVYQDYVRDTWDFISKVPQEYHKLPKFLIGAGLGATITNLTAIMTNEKRPGFFGGVIFISPAVRCGSAVVSQRIIRRYRFIGRRLKFVDETHRSGDADVVANYRTDSLVCNVKIKARMASELMKAMAMLESSTTMMSFPFLICQGEEDQIASPSGAKHLFDSAPSKDKELKLYKGMHHDLVHDRGHETVHRDIVSWIAARTGASSAEYGSLDEAAVPPEEERPRRASKGAFLHASKLLMKRSRSQSNSSPSSSVSSSNPADQGLSFTASAPINPAER